MGMNERRKSLFFKGFRRSEYTPSQNSTPHCVLSDGGKAANRASGESAVVLRDVQADLPVRHMLYPA